jgi:hypothetical protein
MKRILWIGGISVLAVILGAWVGGFIMLPPAQTDPRYAGTILSPEAEKILRVSCYDCHSNETHYVWYNYLPIATSLVARDVIKGRKEVNYSLWNQYPEARRAKKLKEMREEIKEGGMPPWYYTLLHRDAVLSPQAKQLLLSAMPGGTTEVRAEAKETEHKESHK